MAKEKNTDTVSAEEKIKEAARKVFTQKGYAATRTRDIAEAAGLNLALLNYYFRSKEKLFEIVMKEKMQQLFGVITPVLNDKETTLDQKIELIIANYINMLSQHPDLPIFVLSEIRNNSDMFKQMQVAKLIQTSYFIEQLKERQPAVHPLQFIVSILGMTIFPFVAKPVFQSAGVLNEQMFAEMMEQRKVLIPKWMKVILKTK